MLEGVQVLFHPAAGKALLPAQGRLVDQHGDVLFPDPLHDPLDGGGAEIVAAGFHGQPVDAHSPGPSRQDGGGDKILAGGVALHHGADEILGHVLVIGQQLHRVLGQAVAPVAEGGVIVVPADPRVQADAPDDPPRVQALQLSVGVQFVEKADPHGQIGVGKKLDGLRLGGAGKDRGDLLRRRLQLQQRLPGRPDEKPGKFLRCLPLGGFCPDDDAAGVKIVVKGPGFPQKLRAEQNILRAVLFLYQLRVAHGDGGFDHHKGLGIYAKHRPDDLLHHGGVKAAQLLVIVGGDGNDHRVRPPVDRLGVGGGRQIQMDPPLTACGQEMLDLPVPDGADAGIDLLRL